jgi:hypothetical protein
LHFWRRCRTEIGAVHHRRDTALIIAIENGGLAREYDITARTRFITRDNINDLIATGGYRGEIGLLSIDMDGNDYRVWERLDVIRPIIVIC